MDKQSKKSKKRKKKKEAVDPTKEEVENTVMLQKKQYLEEASSFKVEHVQGRKSRSKYNKDRRPPLEEKNEYEQDGQDEKNEENSDTVTHGIALFTLFLVVVAWLAYPHVKRIIG